jgi:hypothetical protein
MNAANGGTQFRAAQQACGKYRTEAGKYMPPG